MARFPVAGVFVDGQGNIVKNGTITAYTYLSSDPNNPTTKATIYASDTGSSTSILGVVTSDSSNGTYLFWVDDGDYGGAQVFTIVLTKTSHVRTLYHQAVLLTASGVTVALDNLASVAINESLISDADVTDNLGSGDIRWKDAWLETLSSGLTATDTLKLRGRDVDGSTYIDVLTITSANTVTADLWASTTIGSNAIADASDHLGFFSATTSLQLLGVISDETGTGSLVFATSPTLVTPVLGVASGTDLTLTGSAASTPDANTLTKDHLIGALCELNGSGTPAYTREINFSGAVGDTALGKWSLTIDRDFAAATYMALGSDATVKGLIVGFDERAAGSITVFCRSDGGTDTDSTEMSIVLIAAQ